MEDHSLYSSLRVNPQARERRSNTVVMGNARQFQSPPHSPTRLRVQTATMEIPIFINPSNTAKSAPPSVRDQGVTCPQCGGHKQSVVLGFWKEMQQKVYYCGRIVSDLSDEPCGHIWIPSANPAHQQQLQKIYFCYDPIMRKFESFFQ